MKYTESLRKNEDFKKVYSSGKSYANRLYIMYVLENNLPVNRLGISVSKKVGNSVVRHRVKRVVREIYRLHEEMFNSGLNIVVIARPAAKDAEHQKTREAIFHLARLAKILKEETDETVPAADK